MTRDEADALWEVVVNRIRSNGAQFKLWKNLRSEVPEELRDYANTLLRGFSQGVVDFATYLASPDALVAAPRTKIADADFIFIYKTGSGFDYFGIRKGDEIAKTTKNAVKLGFAGFHA